MGCGVVCVCHSSTQPADSDLKARRPPPATPCATATSSTSALHPSTAAASRRRSSAHRLGGGCLACSMEKGEGDQRRAVRRRRAASQRQRPLLPAEAAQLWQTGSPVTGFDPSFFFFVLRHCYFNNYERAYSLAVTVT